MFLNNIPKYIMLYMSVNNIYYYVKGLYMLKLI